MIKNASSRRRAASLMALSALLTMLIPAAQGQVEASASAPLPEGTASAVMADQPIAPSSALFAAATVQERPYFHGSSLFALGGALGGVLASGVYKDEPERIAAFVKQEQIDVAGICTAEFERLLELSAASKQALQRKGPGKFKLHVVYGITSAPFSEYKPFLSMRMSFVDDAGVEKWKGRDYVGGNGNAKAQPYAEYLKSAELFKSQLAVAATEVSTTLLKDFAR